MEIIVKSLNETPLMKNAHGVDARIHDKRAAS